MENVRRSWSIEEIMIEGDLRYRRTNRGFNAFELTGILEWCLAEIKEIVLAGMEGSTERKAQAPLVENIEPEPVGDVIRGQA